jgi:predicted nucleic-acid-binding Zn-ribbon protein
MRIKVKRWINLYCKHCKHRTDHQCLPEVQNDHGLLWRCERCLRSEPRTAHQVNVG